MQAPALSHVGFCQPSSLSASHASQNQSPSGTSCLCGETKQRKAVLSVGCGTTKGLP